MPTDNSARDLDLNSFSERFEKLCMAAAFPWYWTRFMSSTPDIDIDCVPLRQVFGKLMRVDRHLLMVALARDRSAKGLKGFFDARRWPRVLLFHRVARSQPQPCGYGQ
jgi:hypothetical protein